MNILIVTTSAASMGDHPTGLWLEEFAVPYQRFIAAGAHVTVASPQGGRVPIDPKTEPDAKQAKAWAPAIAALRDTLPLNDVRSEGYDAIFFPGGHGPMVDLVDDSRAHRLAAEIDARGGIVSAVCHGPAALVKAKGANGEPLVKGRTLTGFSNVEETLAGLRSKVPFLLEDALEEAGAEFKSSLLPFKSRVEVDGRWVTGGNPNSSSDVADAVLERLQSKK